MVDVSRRDFGDVLPWIKSYWTNVIYYTSFDLYQKAIKPKINKHIKISQRIDH
jgi:hypothetical protein